MAKVVLFQPRSELNAEGNVSAFIALCRNELTIFGAELAFEDMAWEIADSVRIKARRGAFRAIFSSWDSVNERVPRPMPEPFGSFAKSYLRYQHGMRPTKCIGFRLASLRALAAALEDQGASNVASVTAATFNRAALLIRAKFSPSAGYRVGSQLEMLASFIDDNRLAAVPLRWFNSIPRPTEANGRVGDEFEAARQAKLPSPRSLECLALAFRAASEPADLFITSAAGIMCSAPDRVNEVLLLRAEPEVTTARPDASPAYGLRFWPSKGADPMVKWVVPSMSSVVREAVRRLNDLSAEARRVARWYERDPKTMFLPSHLEHLRGCDLSIAELGEVLFAESVSPASTRAWCLGNGVPVEKRRGRIVVKFSDVEASVISFLPRGFPWLDVDSDLRYSEALCVVRRNELHRTKRTLRCVIEAPDQSFISTGLGGRTEHGFKSVFDHLGYFDSDGSPIVIRTHQFRHYLNTLAQAGGMSELDIAKWSGRNDVRQNDSYNHVSDRDVQARLVGLRQERQRESVTEMAAEPRPQVRVSLIPREKFTEMGIQAAHTTDFGVCVHDFVMSPCALHRDCTNCNEQVCIKGDEIGDANTRAKLAETSSLLAEAEAADAEGIYGASRWVEHQRLALSRLSELVAILDDPQVPPGALIRLTHIRPASRVRQAVDARRLLDQRDKEQVPMEWAIEVRGTTS
ncbi:integrase [Stenotrophomonas maltophilia]|uniref:integrase n=1 Tax=Stenotrophomonas maltophilia TaxID=40324 RepID=UPI0006AC2E39|nr:integrase [Stenotrophomonas maltophilia]KOQ67374.1 integrase [Stenotrophomonas maltophilia]UXB41202.1 integrase [Stenotrophomonas maltophilia]